MSATLGTVQTAMGTGLIRRNGRYSTRRVIPLDLQPVYGRREIVRALGTADPKEAKRRHALAWVELDIEFEARRAELAGKAAADEPAKLADISPTVVGLVRLDGLRAERDAAAARGELPAFTRFQRDALAMAQAMLDGDIEPTMDLREIEGVRNGLRAFLTGEGSFAISAARVARAEITAKRSGPATPLSEVVKRWAAERKPIPRTVRRAENIVDRFEAVAGKLSVEAITKQHVIDFKDKMLEAGTPANTNVMLTLLGVVLNYAVANNLIPINPASKIKVQDKRLAKTKRDIFDEAALKSIFSSPVYTDGLRPSAGGGEASYWLPLLALYTGARLDELGQLHPEDVHREDYRDGDDERAAWVIRITDNEERGQRLKNEGSRRRVPVHADLIALGFLDVAKAASVAGRARIFHELRPATDGKETGNFSKWFGRYRRAKLGLKGTDTPFHSFRHTFKHYSRLARIPADVHNEITGHETGDVADNYGGMSYPLAPLVDGIKRYRVPGFTLPAPPKP
jgi:integrase